MEVEDCQSGVSEAVEVLDETIQLFKLGHVMQAMTYLMHKIGVIKQDFLSCSQIAPVFQAGLTQMSRVGGFGDWTGSFMKAVAGHPFTAGKDLVEVAIYILSRDWARIGDAAGDLTSLIIEEADF